MLNEMTVVQREIATLNIEPADRFIRRDWGLFPETRAAWLSQGWDGDAGVLKYDESPFAPVLVNLVGIDAPLYPEFDEKVIKEKNGFTFMQTKSGAIEKFLRDKPRYYEIMPEYIKHPVQSNDEWFNDVKPRLNPDTPGRWSFFNANKNEILRAVESGEKLYYASGIGAYMYLRALLGPEGVMYAFYDDPDLIRDMMDTWLHLSKTALLRVQSHVPYFKYLIGEDICYKNGPLISPEMMEEFIFPYYRDLLTSLQLNQRERIHFEMDTDGNCDKIIPLYKAVGFDIFTPFEVAAGNDIIQIGSKHTDIVMFGGVDKRVLADSKTAIKSYVDEIMPVMNKRGGYVPTCDHAIPSNVTFDNYLYYRELMMKY